MASTEKPRPVAFSDVVKGGTVRILDGLTPEEKIYFQRLLEARNGLKEGNQAVWKQFSQDNNAWTMAKKLRETARGRELMELIYRGVPLKDGINLLVEKL